jgi:alanine dehydrogenase
MNALKPVVVLNQADLARLLSLRAAIRAVRKAFIDQAMGRAVMPSKIYLQVPQGDFRAMPAYLSTTGACGIKWVNVHPRNRVRGLPSVMAALLLNDARTGRLLAILDGGLITRLRTAAAAAVASKALARPGSSVLGMVGCGAQAPYQVLALAQVFRLKRIKLWGYLPGEAAGLAQGLQRLLPGVVLQPVATVKEAAGEVDILTTVTPAVKALVKADWVSPGTHINAMGADAPGKQELEHRLLQRAYIVVDERAQASHGGELNTAIARGAITRRAIRAELGQVLAGQRPGRKNTQVITLFDSTGLATHDVALAHEAYRLALRRGLGRRLHL